MTPTKNAAPETHDALTRPAAGTDDAAPHDDWRSACPISRTLDLIGDRWSLVIGRDLFYREWSTFKELSASPERIPTNTLTDRLRKMEASGLIRRRIYQERPKRYQYALTERGRALGPVLRQLALYGLGGDEDALARWAANMKSQAQSGRDRGDGSTK